MVKIIGKVTKIYVLDLANTFKESTDNVIIINKDNSKEFIDKLKEEVSMDTYYLIIGFANIQNNMDKEVYNEFIALLNNQQNYPLKHIIIVGSIEVIKTLRMENWFKNNVSDKFYIWLGDDISNQYTLNPPNISYEDKKINFEYMGYSIYKGKYEIIKYVVNTGDLDE